MSYHVNPATGDTGKCRAEKRCPFGDKDEHFSSEKDARAFYEDRMLAHQFSSAKKLATGNRSIVPVGLRVAYTRMMVQRVAGELKDDAVTEAVLLANSVGAKERPHGPRGGNFIEGVKKVGIIARSLGGLVKLPFVRSTAARLMGAAGAAGALLSPTGLAIGGGVAAVGGAVALGYFGRKAFTEVKASLLDQRD